MSLGRFVVLGAGESGVGTAILAKSVGYDVFVSDYGVIADHYKSMLIENEIAFEENQHTESAILNAVEIMKSPGIPEKAPIIKSIRAKNISIVSELEFAFRYQKGKIIGITGSNGKTTTTNLVYHLFKNDGLSVGMAGNIGVSFAYMVAKEPKDIYILEISSFQLDDIDKFKCDVAILLNISPDHLDRYDYDMKKYVSSKFRITRNQTQDDILIYCKDDEETSLFMNQNAQNINAQLIPFSIQEKLEYGGFVDQNKIIINTSEPTFSMLTQEITIKGKHNQYNSLAAGIAAKSFDIKNEKIRDAFVTFKSIAHRMETVLNIQGVEYINDSKATNVNSTWYALESMDKNVVWIVGGVDKGNDYEVLKALVRLKVKAIVCLGIDNIKIHNEFGSLVDVMISVDNMKDAVRSASKLAAKGEVVLLSPCCASFDLFKNYEDRGDQFKQCVREL